MSFPYRADIEEEAKEAKPSSENFPLPRRIMDRAKEFPSEAFYKHMREDYYTPNQDIIKDYMDNDGTAFEEAMKWAVKEDAWNDPRLLYRNFPYMPASYLNGLMLNNFISKAAKKRELEKAGVKRLN